MNTIINNEYKYIYRYKCKYKYLRTWPNLHQNLEDGRKVGVQFRLIDSLPHYCGGGVGGVGGSTIKLYQDCGLGDPVWGIARLDF